ncbi:glycosyltransferase family 2 protein [Octadecabacter sp.]|nr:glycosyltransferase family 2 protein [Octadecabacter sp.]
MRITAIKPMKNEGPFILEWLAYHLMIGINDFVVFTNDCEDGTDAILERLDELGLVRDLPNPSCVREAADGHNWAAMSYVDAMPRLRRSDLFDAVPNADFISMNQLNFGCSGVETYDLDTMLMDQFDRSMHKSNQPYGWNRARGVKTITRGSVPFDRMGNHSPMCRAKI